MDCKHELAGPTVVHTTLRVNVLEKPDNIIIIVDIGRAVVLGLVCKLDHNDAKQSAKRRISKSVS
jgi:hypothetical protein